MLSQRRMMSNLSKLAKSMKPSTMLDRNKFSKEFRERYPVIQENFLDVTGKQNYHQVDSALNFTTNDRLETQIRDIGDQQFRKTNVKAHMTSWFLQEHSDEFRWISTQAIELAKKHNPHEVEMYVYDCWGAIYNEGSYTIRHNHWPHLWSFVYYVRCPENCAPLVLDGMVTQSGRMGNYFYPTEGDMIMFPGWINHSVPKHESKNDRVVIAGNLSWSLPK
jgi:hypothetical protein